MIANFYLGGVKMSLFKKASLMLLCIVLLVCVFAACDNSGDNGSETSAETSVETVPEYTITYDANGGTISNTTQTVTYGYDVILATPEREGYTFAGWYDGETKYESGKWSASNDVTLKAKWTANNYTIKYDANGGYIGTNTTVIVDA